MLMLHSRVVPLASNARDLTATKPQTPARRPHHGAGAHLFPLAVYRLMLIYTSCVVWSSSVATILYVASRA